MPREPRTAYLIPVKISDQNYYDRKHWRWIADVCWQGELLCTVHIACTGYHRRKKDAVSCALKKLKRLGVKPEHVCVKPTEKRNDADWVGTECLWCGRVDQKEWKERQAHVKRRK